MLKVVVDEQTQRKLFGCVEEVELYNESGELLARLAPDPAYRKKVYDSAWSKITNEEVEQARRQRGQGRTLAEIRQQSGPANGSVHGHLEPDRDSATR
jgi:hypothetical protein